MVKLGPSTRLGIGVGVAIMSWAASDSASRGDGGRRLVAPVSGRITLLGADARPSRDVESAVVYLEPIAPPPRAPEPPAPAPAVAAPPPTATPAVPRDTLSVVWAMVRELRQAVADLRDAVRQLRAQLAGGPPAGPLPSVPADTVPRAQPAPTVAPSAAANPGATPVGVPTGAPPGTPGGSAAAPPRIVPGASIAMQLKTFEPHVRVVEVGGLVEFPNLDPFSHNVFSSTSGGAFDLGLYSRGERRGVTFRRPGSYSVYCNIHSKMSAFIVAVPTALHARPQPDGRFTIEGVPAGRYRLHVWHERAPEQVMPLTVGERGTSDVQVTLDGRTFRPVAHLNKFGQPYQAPTRDAY